MATIDVNGMTYAVCVSRVESAILELDGINSVAVNLARGSVSFSGDVNVEKVIRAVKQSGYTASEPINYFQKWKSDKEKSRRNVVISSISLVYALISMYYLMNFEGNHTVIGFASMCIILALNWSVLHKGFRSIRYGVNMYTLVLLAFICALSSILNLDQAMWEATFIVIAFVGFGDSLESLAKNSATSSFAELSSMVSIGDITLEMNYPSVQE